MTKNLDSTNEKTPKAYRDLQEHVAALEKADRLVVVYIPINKDTELHPLVRWQYRGGIPDGDRKAFLFTNVMTVVDERMKCQSWSVPSRRAKKYTELEWV